jgi:hypothetical protein
LLAIPKPEAVITIEVKVDGRPLFSFPLKLWAGETKTELAYDLANAVYERVHKMVTGPVQYEEKEAFKAKDEDIPF